MYESYKIYGPYQGKDKRLRIVAVNNGIKKTVSYPKYLMEMLLGRYLNSNETVDHIDGDFTNNSYENLVIKDRSIHISDDVKRYKDKKFVCPSCNITFILSGRKLHDAIHNKSAGPFCSRSCAGKYGRNIRDGYQKLKIIKIIPEYTTKKLTQSLLLETVKVDNPKTGKP